MGVHPIEHFRRRLEGFGAYPPGVVPVPAYLPGTAFFAASAGLYRRAGSHLLPPFPFGGWMFVGHNLDAEGPFRRRLESGHSHGDPARPMRTWQNLYKLLAKSGVDPRECFFTNAYVGLKEGDDPTGRFPGSGDAAFRQWCAEFLMDQLAVMRPRAVATLGVDAARFLSSVIPDLRDWDCPRLPQPRPRTALLHSHHFGVVALVHPSAHHVSLHRRSYGKAIGLEAEAALLVAATRGWRSSTQLAVGCYRAHGKCRTRAVHGRISPSRCCMGCSYRRAFGNRGCSLGWVGPMSPAAEKHA